MFPIIILGSSFAGLEKFSSHTCTNQNSAGYWSWILCKSLEFSLWYSVLWTLATWVFLDFQFCLLSSGNFPASAWVHLSCTWAWKLSPKALIGAVIELILLVSHYSSSLPFVAWDSVSGKSLFHVFCAAFLVVLVRRVNRFLHLGQKWKF